MAKFITKFGTTAELTTFSATTDFGRPHVSLTEDDSKVHYFGDPTHNGPEYVDLGLPSGLKWATCNLGASSSEQPGKYYAWGETTGYTTKQIEDGERQFNSSEYNYNDELLPYDFTGNLDADHDAATAERGSNWRMPTSDECQELINGTTQEWTTSYNGVPGHIIKSKTNSNTIFLPAAGCATSGSLAYMGDTDMYLTSTSVENYKMNLLQGNYYYDEETQSDENYFFIEGMYERGDFGYPIRPVYVG